MIKATRWRAAWRHQDHKRQRRLSAAASAVCELQAAIVVATRAIGATNVHDTRHPHRRRRRRRGTRLIRRAAVARLTTSTSEDARERQGARTFFWASALDSMRRASA